GRALAGIDPGERALAGRIEALPVADLHLGLQPAADHERRRLQRDRLLVALQRFRVLAEHGVRDRKVAPRLGAARGERGDPAIARDRLLVALQIEQDRAVARPCFGVVRLCRYAALAALQRFD